VQEHVLGVLTVALALASCGQPVSQSTSQASAPIAPPRDSSRIEYEFAEKCGNDARNWYHHFIEEGSPSEEQRTITYSNHYNSRLNKCFADVTQLKATRDNGMFTNRFLIDVNENREVGSFLQSGKSQLVMACSMANRDCKSDEEWKAMLAPYVEQ
jgi:hypothetical protein